MRNKKPTIGTVTSVVAENGAVYVTVRSSRPGVENTLILFQSPVPWIQAVPEQGDVVEVYQMEDGTKVARSCHSILQPVEKGDFAYPDLGEREMIIKPDANTEVRLSKDGAGNYDVSIKASGDVTVDGTNINLGTSGKALVTEVNTNSDGTVASVEKTTKTNAE